MSKFMKVLIIINDLMLQRLKYDIFISRQQRPEDGISMLFRMHILKELRKGKNDYMFRRTRNCSIHIIFYWKNRLSHSNFFFTEMTSIKRNVTSLEALNVIFSVFKQIFRDLWCGYIIKCQMNLFFYRLHANLHVLCQTLISVMLNAFLVWVSIFRFFISSILEV